MRIVLSCLPTMGGSAISTVSLAEALAERGHTVAVVAAAPPYAILAAAEPAREHLVHGGVSYHWPAEVLGHPVLGDDALATARTAQLVGTVARDLGADVVNPHYLGGLLPAAALAVHALAPDSALVATACGTDVTMLAPGTDELTAALLQHCPVTTTVSPFLAERLVRDLRLPGSAVRVIRNWAEPPPEPDGWSRELLARAHDGATVFVYASNYRPVKRAERCADALAAARRVGPVRLLLLGDGPGRNGVLERARELGVGEHVLCSGRVSPEQARALVAGADLALLPSASEGCSGFLLQAMVGGVATVAYDVGGNAGVCVDGSTGLLVPDEPDADGTDGDLAFARAAQLLVAEPGLRQALGAGGRVVARRFDRTAAVTAYESAYAHAVRRRTPPLRRAS